MRRLILLILLASVAGCSNAPVAGLLDCVSPARGGGNAGREPVIPRIKPPGTETLPPSATNDVLPPITPRN